jgi:hypothetical protein
MSTTYNLSALSNTIIAFQILYCCHILLYEYNGTRGISSRLRSPCIGKCVYQTKNINCRQGGDPGLTGTTARVTARDAILVLYATGIQY